MDNIGLFMASLVKQIGSKISEEFMRRGFNLPFDHYVLLSILYEKDDVIQNDLAQILKKDKSGILRQIDALEKKKMVVRVQDSEDRRRKTLVLTKTGFKTIEELKAIESEVFNSLLSGISEEELKEFESVLKKMHMKL